MDLLRRTVISTGKTARKSQTETYDLAHGGAASKGKPGERKEHRKQTEILKRERKDWKGKRRDVVVACKDASVGLAARVGWVGGSANMFLSVYLDCPTFHYWASVSF